MMSALQTPDCRTANLHVLVKLACSPDPHTAYTDGAWVGSVHEAVRDVRDELVAVHVRGESGLRVSTVAGWRTRLHRVLTDAAVTVPDRWQYWFEPGSWLERNVHLQRVLAEVTDEAEGSNEVALTEMNVPGRLGWPSWALPGLPVWEVTG